MADRVQVVVHDLEILYCAALVLFVLCPEGEWPLPLGVRVREVPLALVVERRLYAIEGWLAAGALALYLALTEVGPRRAG